MKRLAYSVVFVAVVAGVGAVGGVLYPYTEWLFNDDLSENRRSDHVDTMMIDNADLAKRRAWVGAGYAGGMAVIVLGGMAYRRRREDSADT